jgi:DNA-binding response OmpR family regulator
MDRLDALRVFQNQLHIPVIFLTARHREHKEALGMELGAADYITKPCNFGVVVGHSNAVLRRTATTETVRTTSEAIAVGDLMIDPVAHIVTPAGELVELTPREFDLLRALAVEAGHVLTVDHLLSRVWGAEFVGQPQVVYVHIRGLREKIEEDSNHPQKILTVRGVGYKLETHRD